MLLINCDCQYSDAKDNLSIIFTGLFFIEIKYLYSKQSNESYRHKPILILKLKIQEVK